MTDNSEARNDLWSIEENYIDRHHVEPSVKLCPRKNHSQSWSGEQVLPRMCCWTAVQTIIGTLMATGNCLNLGLASRNSLYWTKNLQMGAHGPGERLTRIQATWRPDHLSPEIWLGMWKAAQRREKQQWAIEKPKLDNSGNWEASILSIQKILSWKKPWKNARKSWNCQWKQSCFVRSRTISARKLAANRTLADRSMHASWTVTNLRESVWKELCFKIMKITSRRKGSIREVTTIWCTNLFPCLEQWKIPDAKAAVDKEWEKLEKLPPQECGVGTIISKIQRPDCARWGA